MKSRASFTLDKETIKILDQLVKKKKFRNRSHAVEDSIKILWGNKMLWGENGRK